MVEHTDGLLYQTGQGYSALDAQSARDRLDGYAVVSGLDVTPAGSLSVDVSPGEAIVGRGTNGDTISVSPGSTQTVSLAAADSSNPRKDTVWIDDTGAAQVATGTAETPLPEGNSRFNTFQPEPPFPGGDGTILAEVYVAAGASSLTSADIRDRRQPAQIVGEEIQTATATHDSLNTEQIANGSIYAGNYSGSDPDARLDAALSDANGGEVIILEGSEYTADRTIPGDYTWRGSGRFGASDTLINGSWTLNAYCDMAMLRIGPNSTITVTAQPSTIHNCTLSGSIVSESGRGRFVNLDRGEITLVSGTSGQIVDACSQTSVIDNGTNTVGDIA